MRCRGGRLIVRSDSFFLLFLFLPGARSVAAESLSVSREVIPKACRLWFFGYGERRRKEKLPKVVHRA